MYKARVKIEGKFKDIVIRNDVYRNLLDRLDVRKAKFEKEDEVWTISISCLACRLLKKTWGCGACPFDIDGEGSGCLALIEKFCPSAEVILESSCLWWSLKDDKKARFQLTKIRNEIKKRFRKVEK